MSYNNNPATLITKVVGSLNHHFFVPNYQRGYRWGRQNVKQLLDDLRDNGSNTYYLQPIVVTKKVETENDYIVIDGQQRLTTLFLIYQCLQDRYKSLSSLANQIFDEELCKCDFDITYETKEDSKKFLSNIADATKEDAIATADRLYMYHAFLEIDKWVDENKVTALANISKYLSNNVFLIWYEIEVSEDETRKIFWNLNSGKIRLTNAELVKALFLSKSQSDIDEVDKRVIASQWDDIEKELKDPLFWSFLTNRKLSSYPTKIELLFDMIASKKENELDEFYTFLYFDGIISKDKKNKRDVWNDFYIQFLKFKDWYTDRDYYHKIGYLVATATNRNQNELQNLYNTFSNKDMTNSKFKKLLDKKIRERVNTSHLRIEDLNYNESQDVNRLLTLFNVMYTLQLKDETQRYPFYHHKNVNGGWSLEHIHAQQSDSLNKSHQWTKWVDLHHLSLERYIALQKQEEASEERMNTLQKLEQDMESFLKSPENNTQAQFNDIIMRYASAVVNPGDNIEYKDRLENLALLGKDDNSILNNSTFDVKREIVTKDLMLKSYVPICTQRVFLKAFTSSEKNQLFFWGEDDRRAYISEIKHVLEDYLPTISDNFQKLFKDIYGFDKLWDEITLKHKNSDGEIDMKAIDTHLNDIVSKSGKSVKDSLAFYENIKERHSDNSEELINELKEVIICQ